ncbi:hypothetical protein QVD17_28171 [Tagetes erecta]|uniref:Uncharacterized protein n=1 Tax=Tagetes erecta TaxID=13708 RepID=A0AAD8K9V7_TARER|nr:hypothetical protein QVD17_28171 [Tagetes erecta]
MPKSLLFNVVPNKFKENKKLSFSKRLFQLWMIDKIYVWRVNGKEKSLSEEKSKFNTRDFYIFQHTYSEDEQEECLTQIWFGKKNVKFREGFYMTCLQPKAMPHVNNTDCATTCQQNRLCYQSRTLIFNYAY